MNKTVKTVLITLAAVFFVLVVIVMIFGDDPVAPDNSSSDVGESTLAVSDTSSSNESNEVINNDAGISQEEMNQTLAYDIFDWNGADDQGKLKIAQDIMMVWDAGGSVYSISAEGLVEFINQNLQDQANVFEVACTAENIDSSLYFGN